MHSQCFHANCHSDFEGKLDYSLEALVKKKHGVARSACLTALSVVVHGQIDLVLQGAIFF